MLDDFTFSSIQSAERLNYRKVNVLNCWEDTVKITLGKATTEGGQYAYIALDRAVRDLKDGLIDVLVTGPVNKHAMQMVNFPATGHTEYLENELGGKSLMLMVSEEFRVALVTAHIPLSEVPKNITKENVGSALTRFIDTLRVDFGLDKPKIAVLGLNPHASDEGLMGTEEEEVLQPVILEFKKAGHLVMGPYSSDGFFGSGLYRKFDGILAMYHDQGLIPFKALSFGQGVNYTAGLPFIRTSPDHGTAYDLVGNNSANEQSFRRALYLAIDMFKAREDFKDLEENSLRKGRKQVPDFVESNKTEEPENESADLEELKNEESETVEIPDVVENEEQEKLEPLSDTIKTKEREKLEPLSDSVESVKNDDSGPSEDSEESTDIAESNPSTDVPESTDNAEMSPSEDDEEENKKEPKSSEDVESAS